MTQSVMAARLAGTRLLCVGDVMLDRYIYGDVARMSPEAPVPVLRAGRESAMLGGAGNVVRNLSLLGAHATLIAQVGSDREAGEIRRLLAELPGTRTVLPAGAARTTVKTRYVAAPQQLLRVDAEQICRPANSVVRRMATAAADAAFDAMILSDYGKGLLSPGLVSELVAVAAGRPVIVDPRGPDFSIYRGATLATPNLEELAVASRMAVAGDRDIVAAARRVLAASGIGTLLVTRGAAGMTLVTGDAPPLHLQTRAREVFDVSGAGDTVVAVMAAGLAAGLLPAVAMRLANAAAGIVVGKVGTAAVTPDELDAALQPGLPAAGARIPGSERELARCVRDWRAAGLKIGFTNGCFDLLHAGHVSLLDWARRRCDRLIVGLNDDASVRRLKGAGRPVRCWAERAAVLAGLRAVDAVAGFAGDTPRRLIAACRPDVLVKGADYRPEEIAGADMVTAGGGSVLLAPLVPGVSTSATVAALRSGPAAEKASPASPEPGSPEPGSTEPGSTAAGRAAAAPPGGMAVTVADPPDRP